jgi:hypothetical protein
MSEASRSSMRSPRNSMLPVRTSPSSMRRMPEIALRSVDLPAPLAPRSVTTAPAGTSTDAPFSTRMMCW